MSDSRRFTVLFTPEEWARIEARRAELRRDDPRVTYTDVVRQLARTLPDPRSASEQASERMDRTGDYFE